MSQIPMDTRTVYGRPGMATAVENDAEWAVIAHLRGHVHNSADCELCTQWTQRSAQIVRTQATINSLQRRATQAEIHAAYLAREVMEAQADAQEARNRARKAEVTLNSIIEG